MAIVILFARLLLAAVFVVAGVAKLADREGSRRAVADFGVPERPRRSTERPAASGRACRGRRLDPHLHGLLGRRRCSGTPAPLRCRYRRQPGARPQARLPLLRPDSSPAGWSTLARNGVLAAIAAFVVWQGLEGEVGPSVIGWLGALSTTQLLIVVGGTVVLALVAVQWFFLFGVLRQNGRLLARLNALENRLAAAGLAPSENGIQSDVRTASWLSGPYFRPEGPSGARR